MLAIKSERTKSQTAAYLTHGELVQELLGLVVNTHVEGSKLNIETGVLSGDQDLEGTRVLGVSVEFLYTR
jgi:hypothetical protein